VSILIRDYKAGDSDQVVALVKALQAHERALYDRMRDPADMGDWYLHHLQVSCAENAGRILVAERDAEILGYACVLTDLSSAEERDEVPYRYACVLDIVVSETSRGQGIGQRLLAACEGAARGAGRRWLRITHLADNRAAGLVYERFGFRNLLIEMEKPLD